MTPSALVRLATSALTEFLLRVIEDRFRVLQHLIATDIPLLTAVPFAIHCSLLIVSS